MSTDTPVAAASRPATSDLISTLRGKAPRLAMTLAAGQLAWPAAKMIRAKARERTTYTVKVPGSDDIYDDLHEWVLSLLAPDEQRALVAWSSTRGMLMHVPGDGAAGEEEKSSLPGFEPDSGSSGKPVSRKRGKK